MCDQELWLWAGRRRHSGNPKILAGEYRIQTLNQMRGPNPADLPDMVTAAGVTCGRMSTN